ncbi:MAG: hypothetical protein Q9201_002699 [Fulgogasparrea decipioides]
MADAVGLVIGIAGLAGVFNACLEAFSLFHASRALGRDFEILLTKLDIEKTLLLHWAERVGLPAMLDEYPGYDPRLNDPGTHSAVVNALSCILYLLTDSERLRSRYGVVPGSPEMTSSQSIEIVSSDRMGSFARSYQQLQIRMGKRQENVKAFLRTKWAIRDRERFSSLIEELGKFNKYLNELLPTPAHYQQRLVHEEIERLAEDVHNLRLVQEASEQNHRDWSDAASARADISEVDLDDLQRIEDWRKNIPKSPPEGSSKVGSSNQLSSTQDYDLKAFCKAATGSTETLVQLCESGTVSVTALDRSGHSLLRHALNELHMDNARVLLQYGSDVNSLELDFDASETYKLYM